eukprot:2961872-Pleurochrysis_carterae.AAC.1
MVSDVDVVWLRPPWPLVRYGHAPVAPSAALLALADVVLSVDQARARATAPPRRRRRRAKPLPLAPSPFPHLLHR